MSRIELAIKKGNYKAIRTAGAYAYIVTIDESTGAKFPYNKRLSANDFHAVCERIRRADFRRSCANYTAEHSASYADIMDAYNDYQACLAF